VSVMTVSPFSPALLFSQGPGVIGAAPVLLRVASETSA
jgi:hypothetical protein